MLSIVYTAPRKVFMRPSFTSRARLRFALLAIASMTSAFTACADTMTVDDAAMDSSASDASDVATTDTPITPGCAAGNRSQCVVESSVGNYFACARLFDGTVWCWGRNDVNQLGYSTMDVCIEQVAGGMTRSVACHSFPFQVTGLEGATGIASGASHSCASVSTADGSFVCWGGNEAGQLGDGSTLPALHPGPVAGIANVTSFSLGARHTCVVASGQVSCWGANDRNQLGVMDSPAQCDVGGATRIGCAKTPVMVAGLSNVAEVSAGAAHTCARTTAGNVMCWGDNRYGQIGIGAANAMPTVMPARVGGAMRPLDHVVSIRSGSFHTCALRDDGSMFCWGRDDAGQLGTAAPATMPAMCVAACIPGPTQVNGLPHPAPVPSGDAGVMDGGSTDASVRDASPDANRDAMVVDTGPPDTNYPISIAAGGDFTCAQLTDQTVRCWGSDTVGQLGDGTASTGPQGIALVIAAPGASRTNPLQDTTAVVSGGASSCSRLSDGSLRCWGSNQDGALGIGGTSVRNGPVPVNW